MKCRIELALLASRFDENSAQVSMTRDYPCRDDILRATYEAVE